MSGELGPVTRAERAEAEVKRLKSRRRRIARVRTFLGRWAWLGLGLLLVGSVVDHAVIGAALWGVLLGQEIESRFRTPPPRAEIRVGLSDDEADQLRDELLDEVR